MIEELLVLQTFLQDAKEQGDNKEVAELTKLINNLKNGTPKGNSHGTD